MDHVVHYRDVSGTPHLEDVPSMDAAVALIERLRNEDGAEDVRLFREVPLRVRTYYKVVVDEPEAAGAAEPAPHVESPGDEPPPGAMNLAPPPAPASSAVPGEDEAAEEPRRASLFNRG